jgi:hypothetical protein
MPAGSWVVIDEIPPLWKSPSGKTLQQMMERRILTA